MSEDDLILFGSASILVLLIGLIFFKNWKFGMANIIIYLLYSPYMFYSLYFESTGGSGLAWLLYHVFLMWFHSVIILVVFLVNWLNSRKKNGKTRLKKGFTLSIISALILGATALTKIAHYSSESITVVAITGLAILLLLYFGIEK